MSVKKETLEEVLDEIRGDIMCCAAFNGTIPEDRCEGSSCDCHHICQKVKEKLKEGVE